MPDNVVQDTKTATSSSYTFSYGAAYCPYRLPCGLCNRTMTQCPKAPDNTFYPSYPGIGDWPPYGPSITWTCSSSASEK